MLAYRLNPSFLNDVWWCLSSSGWWFQPIWKICSSNWKSSPINFRVKIKDIWVATTQTWSFQNFNPHPTTLALVLQGSSERSLDKKSATRCCLLCRYSLCHSATRIRLHWHHEDDISRGNLFEVWEFCSNLQFPTLSGVQYFQNQNPPL